MRQKRALDRGYHCRKIYLLVFWCFVAACKGSKVLLNDDIDDPVAVNMLPTGATGDKAFTVSDIDQANLIKILRSLKPSELRMALGDVLDDIQEDLAGLHDQVNLIDNDVVRNQMSIRSLDGALEDVEDEVKKIQEMPLGKDK